MLLTTKRRMKRFFKGGGKWLRNRYHLILIMAKTGLGIPVRYSSPARTVLENIIIPYYASHANTSRLLFVGCDWYTKHYRKYFKKCEYWTIDSDPQKKRYGAKNHIVDLLENLDQHFDEEYFDVIICNGVLGFGLNQLKPAEKAFQKWFLV